MRDAEIVAVEGESDRATVQSADIVLGEAASRAAAAWWIVSAFARYPGCLVAAVRHEQGHWCVLAVRGHEPELARPCFGGRLSRRVVEDLARALHERMVTS